ncbi:hypothetical protein Bbelb_036430 [Branchiostoma belcheri]|nr:hypothetical protein Bbelb_036430 [Branchiostoma belcheri]
MAAANGHLHPSMNWDADDLVEEYKKFKQKTELAFKSFLKDTEPEQQVSYILLWVGSQGLDLFNSWEFTDAEDAKKPDKILEKFETHLEPKTNHRIYRYEFQGIQQKPDEPIDDYVARLKNVAKKCKFKDDAETKDRLVDQLIWGCIHKKVQKTLVGKSDLTLKDAMDTARAFEATQKQMSSLSMQTGTSSSNRVDAVSKKTYQAGSKQKQPHMYKTYKQSTKSCRYCGNTHEFGDRAKCPAYGSNCNACGKPNHWGKMCRAKNRPQHTQNKPQQPRRYGKQKQRHVHLQRENQLSSESEGESLTIGTVYIQDIGNKEQKSQDEAYTSFQIRKKLGRKTTNIDLKLKIDTGAQSNVMPIQHYAKLCPEHMMKDGRVKSGILTPSDVILTAYGGARIPHLGKAQIKGKHKGRKVKCSFFITKAEGPIILGLKACQQLDIIRINHEVKTSQRIDSDVPIKDRPPIRNKEECIAMYPECFDNTVGCFDEEYHITVDPTVEPVVHPPRRVPLELREKLREQLNEMVEKGVISQVTQPTDWVNSIVVKEKPNGKLRVCLDPRDLNNALKRDHYPTPTLEEITPSLAGAKIFSKLDASNGYWNIKIDEESSLLTTFNTPFGRFKFNRLPFGLKVSQDVFQRKVDETYRGCKGAIGIADDIQVFGKTERDHDLHLHEAMEKTRQAGIKLNAAKCTIKESECTFFGMIYSADGVKPDPEKVEAITNMEEPRDKKELRSFLGLIQYMSSFIPRLADHTASIRELLKEDVEYDWCASHTRDFNKIKQLISEDITLQYYDREKPVTLQVDASMKGVGAALLQEGRPIAFASKALTPAESRYANIEREMLAVVYGCEKFKTYLYGRRFTIESDHKPLEQIDRKNLTKAPARLQRLLLRIQEYDYHLKYKPGNEMLVADALSRLSSSEKEEMAGLKVQIHHLVNVTTTKLEQIQEETSKDEELQTLAQTITRGWPEKRSEVQPLIREYWTIRDDISIENGVLLAGSRIIIPKSLQKEVLQTIHEGHMGEEKCKLRAKSAVYWIGMYKEIEKIVQTCRTCQKYQNSQQKEEMTPTETPSRPWKKVGADLFYLNQKWFLLVVDYYSKFPIVKTLKSLKASTVTQAFKGIFAEQGIPDEVICDNGAQFTSQEFRQAAEEYGFRITTSSPYYPKGHGFIERQVQTVKKTLTKSLETGEDPNLALLTLRTTPLRTDTKSPAELLNGRRYKTRLPTKIHPPADQEEVMGKLTAAQEKSKKQYDRQAQRLPELVRGQTVHIQEPIKKTWTPGQIVGKADTPKSYVVETESGKQMRRNRVHIRPTPETTTTIQKYSFILVHVPTTPPIICKFLAENHGLNGVSDPYEKDGIYMRKSSSGVIAGALSHLHCKSRNLSKGRVAPPLSAPDVPRATTYVTGWPDTFDGRKDISAALRSHAVSQTKISRHPDQSAARDTRANSTLRYADNQPRHIRITSMLSSHAVAASAPVPTQPRGQPPAPACRHKYNPSARAGTRTTPSARAATRTTPSARAGTRTTPSARAGTRTTSSARAGTRTTPSARAGTQGQPPAPVQAQGQPPAPVQAQGQTPVPVQPQGQPPAPVQAHKDNPQRPCRHKDNPQLPCRHKDNPQRPCRHTRTTPSARAGSSTVHAADLQALPWCCQTRNSCSSKLKFPYPEMRKVFFQEHVMKTIRNQLQSAQKTASNQPQPRGHVSKFRAYRDTGPNYPGAVGGPRKDDTGADTCPSSVEAPETTTTSAVSVRARGQEDIQTDVQMEPLDLRTVSESRREPEGPL